jgi:hypothetical protein
MNVTRKKTSAQLDRDIAKALKKPAMTRKRADEVIRTAQLDGFGGRCGRVAIAINHVVFGDKGRYVIATNPAISKHRGRLFIGHVVVEWKGRLFDATGGIDDEHEVESWGMVDHIDPDYDYLTEEQALDGQLHYIDDLYSSRAEQERVIEAGTRGQCPLRDVEHALREAREATA